MKTRDEELNDRNEIQRGCFGTKELNAEQKPGLSFLGHFWLSPTVQRFCSKTYAKQCRIMQFYAL